MINTKALDSRSNHERLLTSFGQKKATTHVFSRNCYGVHPVGKILGLLSIIFTAKPSGIAAWHETTIYNNYLSSISQIGGGITEK